MRASEVQPKPIEWLLYPYVPLGKLTMVAGQPGQAKSLFTCWLASYTSQRGGNVIMLSAEDDPEDTIRPRLEASGADLARIELSDMTTLNAPELEKACNEVGDVQLVTVDPFQAYVSSTLNSWKGQDVRLLLDPVRRLAAARRFSVFIVQHLNRRADGDPLTRIADSAGLPQACRSVLVWAPTQATSKATEAQRRRSPPPRATSSKERPPAPPSRSSSVALPATSTRRP